MSPWTSADTIRTRLNKAWDQGRLLMPPGDDDYPLRLPLKGPGPGELGTRYDQVRCWVQQWAELESQQLLTLEWRETNSREIGRNRLPVAVLFGAPAQAFAFIGKLRTAQRFSRLRQQILDAFPPLQAWLERRALQALELHDQWPRLLAVLQWLRDHPRPGIYIRQLELPGIDTKFIERHKKVLMELLDIVLEPDQLDDRARGQGGFEQRYGFRAKPAQIRFRLLDPDLYLQGLGDLQIPIGDFARLDLPVDRIFITENDINGLAFPDQARALVIFGLGYGLDSLKEAHWLAGKAIWYWGDIDSHGFAMLDQLRSYLPQSRSLLMDRTTLLAHETLWGNEPRPTRRPLPRLTAEEQALYEDLCLDRIAPSLRLEQERIGFDHLGAALRSGGGH
jgi:hypothetical protein